MNEFSIDLFDTVGIDNAMNGFHAFHRVNCAVVGSYLFEVEVSFLGIWVRC